MRRKSVKPPWWFRPAVLAGVAATVLAMTGLVAVSSK